MTEQKDDLELQFLKRYQKYLEHTQEILQSIPNVLEAISQTLVNEEYGSLQWEDAQYVAEEGVLIMIGNVKVAIGDDIQLNDGRVVSVTEENVNTLRRLVRVSIPINLAQHGSVEDVLEYLSDKQHRNYAPLVNDDDEPQTVADLLQEEEVEKYYNAALQQEVEEVIGFDTEGLTDEQVQQLLLLHNSEKVH